MSNNSIQNIQKQPTDSLADVGNTVGKDGTHSVQNAFTTFKNDLKERSSGNALNTLQKLRYRNTPIDTSNVGKFFLSIGQRILDVCHNIRVALDSSQPALNIGVPIENLRNELLQSNNANAIKNEFEQRTNGNAAKYLRTVRGELTNLKGEINNKLENNKYPDDTKAVLQEIKRYIDEIIAILAPTKTEQLRQFGHELKNDIKDGFQKVGNFFKNAGGKIYEKLPEDKKVEEELNKFGENVENFGKKICKNIQKKASGFGNQMQKIGDKITNKMDDFLND